MQAVPQEVELRVGLAGDRASTGAELRGLEEYCGDQ